MDLSKYSILKCFFGQIWSQKLKFSKLTEIWSRHTLLYPCFEFSVNFLKKFFTHIFWGNWSQNLKFCTRVHYYMFITTLTYFCKIFVIHNFFWANLAPIWSQFPNCKQFFCITTFDNKVGTWDEVCDYVMVGQNIYGMP